MDLTRLNPIELLLVNDKIESHSIINVNKNKIAGHAALLQSPLKNDYSFDFEKKKKRNLLLLVKSYGRGYFRPLFQEQNFTIGAYL